MAQLALTSLTRWEMTTEETLNSQILSLSQVQGIQNALAEVSESLLRLNFDVEKQLVFIQEQSYLMGQKELLQHMLITSDEAQKLLREIAARNSNS